MRKILKRLQVSLPHEASFNTADNSYTNEEFFKICEDYGVSHDPMKYKHGVGWPDDYIGPDSVTRWIIENPRALPMWSCLGYQRVLGLMHI